MQCQEVVGQLSAYADTELPSEIMERMTQHLAVCSECGGLYQELSDASSRVRDAFTALWAPDMETRILTAVLRDTRQMFGLRPVLWVGLGVMFVGTAIFALSPLAGLVWGVARFLTSLAWYGVAFVPHLFSPGVTMGVVVAGSVWIVGVLALLFRVVRSSEMRQFYES